MNLLIPVPAPGQLENTNINEAIQTTLKDQLKEKHAVLTENIAKQKEELASLQVFLVLPSVRVDREQGRIPMLQGPRHMPGPPSQQPYSLYQPLPSHWSMFFLTSLFFPAPTPLSRSFFGSGPDRGRSPVEWGDFPSVRTSIPPPLWAIQLGLRPGQTCLKPEA